MTKPDDEARKPPPAAEPPQNPNAHDPVAVNPFYRGLRFSEVVRILLAPTDPETLERIKRRARRGSGPPPGRTPGPGT